MIEIRNVYKRYRMKSGWKLVLSGVDFSLPRDRSLGILGRNGAGKSTLIRLIAGLEKPDIGEVRLNGTRLSWPLSQNGGAQGSMTGRENIKFICRIYGIDYHDKVDFVEDFASLGEYMDQPVKTYSSGMKARLTFGISMAFDFDTYLVDEGFGGGDSRFKARVQEIFDAKRQKNGCNMIVVSHNAATIERYCNMGAVLENGRIALYDDIQEAISVYNEL